MLTITAKCNLKTAFLYMLVYISDYTVTTTYAMYSSQEPTSSYGAHSLEPGPLARNK